MIPCNAISMSMYVSDLVYSVYARVFMCVYAETFKYISSLFLYAECSVCAKAVQSELILCSLR